MIVFIIIIIILEILQRGMKTEHNIDLKDMKEKGAGKRDKNEKAFGCIAFANLLVGLPFVLYIVIMYPSWITLSILATQIVYSIARSRSKIINNICDILYIVWIILFAINHYHG